MKKFLILNKIDADGDFRFSLQKTKLILTENQGQAFLKVCQIMVSLRDTTEGLEHVVSLVKKFAKKWLKSNTESSWKSPYICLGNQIIHILVSEVDLEKDEDILTVYDL